MLVDIIKAMNTKYTPRNKMTGAVMRGHIDTSGMDKYPDAKYWTMYAKGALKSIREMCGCRVSGSLKWVCDNDDCRITEIVSKFWNEENTWMEICLKTEHVRDLIKALKSKEKNNGQKTL